MWVHAMLRFQLILGRELLMHIIKHILVTVSVPTVNLTVWILNFELSVCLYNHKSIILTPE